MSIGSAAGARGNSAFKYARAPQEPRQPALEMRIVFGSSVSSIAQSPSEALHLSRALALSRRFDAVGGGDDAQATTRNSGDSRQRVIPTLACVDTCELSMPCGFSLHLKLAARRGIFRPVGS